MHAIVAHAGVPTVGGEHGDYALAGGRTLAEVRVAAGHANVAVTSAYLHILVDDLEPVGNLFG